MREFKQETVAAQMTTAPDWLAIGAIVADVLVTVIVIAAMLIDQHSATVSVLSGVAFFLLFGTFVIVTLSGTMTAIVTNGQNQKTARMLYELQYDAQVQSLRVSVVDRPRLVRDPAAAPMQLPDTPRFVPAVPPTEQTVKLDAANFVSQLFDTRTGRPLPAKVTPKAGQIQHKSPSAEAVEYLLALEIVRRGDGGQLYWNRDAYTGYPTYREALNAIRSGVRKASWQEGERVGVEGGGQGYA